MPNDRSASKVSGRLASVLPQLWSQALNPIKAQSSVKTARRWPREAWEAPRNGRSEVGLWVNQGSAHTIGDLAGVLNRLEGLDFLTEFGQGDVLHLTNAFPGNTELLTDFVESFLLPSI